MKRFPLFQSHLDLAHSFWKQIVKPGDILIDATCGNGHDTLALAQMGLTPHSGRLYAIDIQAKAIESCQHHLANHLIPEVYSRIQFIQGCHSRIPAEIPRQSVALIVYNLGYLPGSDKQVVTTNATTIQSLENSLSLIKHGGAISVTCYPGHTEGKIEKEMVLNFAEKLLPSQWSCSHHEWLNRSSSPSVLIMQKHLPAN